MRLRKLVKALPDRTRKSDPVPAKTAVKECYWDKMTTCFCGKPFTIGNGYARRDKFQLYCTKECALLEIIIH